MCNTSVHFQVAYEFMDLSSKFLGLTLKLNEDGSRLITGDLAFSCTLNNVIIEGSFEIEAYIPVSYPTKLPRVRETGGRIPKNFHKLDNGYFCLETQLQIKRIFQLKPCLTGFFNNLVIPYLAGYCYFEKYDEMPFGERAHGGKGILDYYKEIFQVKEDLEAAELLKILAEGSYRGHDLCPCGSKKRLRNCNHGQQLRNMDNEMTAKEYTLDYFHVCSYFDQTDREILYYLLAKTRRKRIRRKKSNLQNSHEKV